MSALPACDPPPAFNSKYFRQVLSQFATGVTVITACLPDNNYFGVTINSFNSVSLEPPLVLWSLAHAASTMAAFAAAPSYVINVLSGEQIELAQRFSQPGPVLVDPAMLARVRHDLPILAGSVAWFACRQRSSYSEGDHMIFVGEVARCHAHPHRTLGFHRSRFIAI